MGRKKHEPTAKNREDVKTLAAVGTPHELIAKVIDCDDKTLRKHYRTELDTAAILATGKVAHTLYQQAIKGNVTAAIFWLKVRGGWREKTTVEHIGEDDGPIKFIDVTGFTREELEAIAGVKNPIQK